MTQPSAGSPIRQQPILVVDDSEFDRAMLTKALSIKADFPVLQADSGERCLEILETQPVGLILMDILMPGTKGTEILTKIRSKYNQMQLPVIMVTAKSDAKDVIECLQAGANDYITKPINFEVAVSRISTHLRLAEISREMAKLKELAALNAVITTYNHEINNPLAIAIATLESPDLNEPAAKERLERAIWRVADIVKKIKNLAETHQIEFEPYTSNSQMLKIK